MRTLACWALVVAAWTCACLAYAADATAPASPASAVTTGPAVVVPPSGVVPQPPLIPGPEGNVPSPVAPSKPPTGYVAPTPQPPIVEHAGALVEFHAEDIHTTFDENGCVALTVAQGNVTAFYKDFAINSDRARADYRTNEAIFEGHVLFKVDGQPVHGERIKIDMKSGAWSFSSAEVTVSPQYAKGKLVAPVFAKAGEITGIRDRQIIAFNAETTTCNLERPHYDLTSRSIAVYPGDKIILRDVTLYALGRRILHLARLVISLRDTDRDTKLIPRVGQSAEEGYFLKTSYAYQASKAATGLLLLDLMSKKGVGTGIDEKYHIGNDTGSIELYGLHDNNIDENTFTERIVNSDTIGTIHSNFVSDLRSNSYLYAPNSQTFTNQSTFTRDRPGADSSACHKRHHKRYLYAYFSPGCKSWSRV